MKFNLFAFLTLLSSTAFGQYQAEVFDAALLEAKYGALLVYNGSVNSFTLRLESKKFETTEQPNFVRVNGVLLQSSIIPFAEKADFANLTIDKQKEYLSGWRAYELGWIEEQLKTKVKDSQRFIEIANRPFLEWTFEMPKSDNPGQVAKQTYLVTICFDQILILNGPIEKGKDEALVKETLLTIARTLQLYPKKTQDIEKLYEELKK